MTQKLPPLPPVTPPRNAADQRWLTQVQQLLNTALGGTVGYYTTVPAAAAVVKPPATASSCLLRPAGVLATLTVTLPGGVADGQVMAIVSSMAITAVTINATGSVAVQGAPTGLGANVGIAFQYLAANAANGLAAPVWQRLY